MLLSPISYSWVVIHPNAIGVIQLIGGEGVGTFPNLFFDALIDQLYSQKYTVVAIPFPLGFNHWRIAFSLLEEQENIRLRLIRIAEESKLDVNLYKDKRNYVWIGHSVGCKYIALLELLSLRDETLNYMQNSTMNESKSRANQIRTIKRRTKQIGTEISIYNQPSILLAPNISDSNSAVPFFGFLLDLVGWGVQPTPQETYDFIQQSSLFNLTGIISFTCDFVSGNRQGNFPALTDSSKKLNEILAPNALTAELPGGHFAPVGLKVGDLSTCWIGKLPGLVPLITTQIESLRQRLTPEA